MQVTVMVSDAIVREAGARGMVLSEFVESLVDKGMIVSEKTKEAPLLSSALDRIRALRSTAVEAKR